MDRARADSAAAFPEAGAVHAASDIPGICCAGKSENAFGVADCDNNESVPGGTMRLHWMYRCMVPPVRATAWRIIYSIFSFRPRGIVWMEARRLTGRQRARQECRTRRFHPTCAFPCTANTHPRLQIFIRMS